MALAVGIMSSANASFMVVEPSSELYYRYAAVAGEHVQLDSGAAFVGDLYSNGDVKLKRGSNVEGDVASVGSIQSLGTVSGSLYEGADPLVLPALPDEAGLRALADRVFEGDTTFSDQVIDDVVFVSGTAVLRGSISGVGTVIATEDVRVNLMDASVTGALSLIAMHDIRVHRGSLGGILRAGNDVRLERNAAVEGVLIADHKIHIKQGARSSFVDFDVTPPEIVLVTPPDGSTVPTSTPEIAVEYSDDFSGVRLDSLTFLLDGVDLTAEALVTPSGFTFTPSSPLAAGVHIIEVSISDHSDNLAYAMFSFTVPITNVPPVISIELPVDGALIAASSITVLGTVIDTDPVSVTVNGISAVVSGSDFTANDIPLVEGPNTIDAQATDSFGATAFDSVTVTRDSTPPAIQILESGNPLVDGSLFDRIVVPVIQVSDANAVTVSATLNGAPYVSGTPVIVDGVYSLVVAATDAAGNAATLGVGFEIALDREVLGFESWPEYWNLAPPRSSPPNRFEPGDPAVRDLRAVALEIPSIGCGSGRRNPHDQQARGDFVNLFLGNHVVSHTDFAVGALGFDVVWKRVYNSRSVHVGSLGHGWSFSYGQSVETLPDGSIRYRDGDGTEHRFVSDGSGGFLRPPGKHLVLLATASGFELTTKDGVASSFSSLGRLLSITDANGNVVSLDYDINGDLQLVVDAAGRNALTVSRQPDGKIASITNLAGQSTSFTYSGDYLVNIIDARGGVTNLGYDADGNLLSQADPLGNVTTYTYDSLDRLVSVTDPLGNMSMFNYASGGTTSVINPLGLQTAIDFDSAGRPQVETDPAGNVHTWTWDGDNNRVADVNPAGGTTSRVYDGDGNLVNETDPLGRVTQYTYDPVYRQVLTRTDAAGNTTTGVYDASGNALSRTDAMGNTTSASYDSEGRLLTVLDPHGGGWSFTYDPVLGASRSSRSCAGAPPAFGRYSTLIDPLGNTTMYGYDSLGRLTTVTDALGNVTIYGYDAAGNQTSVTDPLGNIAGYAYDAIGNLITATDPVGSITTYAYDAVGNLISVTDALGNVTSHSYDGLGRLTVVTDPLGANTWHAYDVIGNKVSVTDPLNNDTGYAYDEVGNLTSVTDQVGSVTSYTYDAVGNLISVTNALGNTTTNSYDSLDRLITVTDPLGGVTQYTYDALGNRVAQIDAEGELVSFTYDVRRKTSVALPCGALETFGYDALGRVNATANSDHSRSFTHDAVGNVLSMTDHTLGQTLTYGYDAVGNRTARSNPAAGSTSYTYDAAGRLTQLDDVNLGLFEYSYDALGRRTQLDYPIGWATSYFYDAAGRLIQLNTTDAASAPVAEHSYTHDPLGNRISEIILPSGVQHDYSYDGASRLLDWQRNDGRFEQYSYDAAGNRLMKADDSGVTTSYVYDAMNRLVTESGVSGILTYSWDANGRLLTRTDAATPSMTSYAWDALGRLRQIDDPAAGQTHVYAYDPLGIRVKVTVNAVGRGYLYDIEDVIATFDSVASMQEFFLHGPGFDDPVGRNLGAGAQFFHLDGLGSVTGLSDAFGLLAEFSYAPFGGNESAAMPDRYGFVAREHDISGLLYFGSRYYDPAVGRFISPPNGAGDLRVPLSNNDYLYALDNPVNHVPPSGEAVLPK